MNIEVNWNARLIDTVNVSIIDLYKYLYIPGYRNFVHLFPLEVHLGGRRKCAKEVLESRSVIERIKFVRCLVIDSIIEN
ncbi:hypothetical protein [Bacillus thuringiensis]|nr:hypothetical protein [Bacillus thuringiensis]MDA2279757.1 hypothetical protein [Bacillus cereus]